MELQDVKWNEQAREKILLDADRALQEAVREAASSLSNAGKDEVYKFLFEKLKPQFVDFQPGPDLTQYAEAVSNGEISANGASGTQG
jgi:phage-related baseplate assembly protein